MVIPPNNEIILLNVPIEIDNKNQLTFANANAQFQYFRYLEPQFVYDQITYVRKDNYVVVNAEYDDVIKYNYAMYQNENFSTKWYYAYILRVEWLSPNSTKVYLKTDVFQTYQFDVEYKVSFIEREHCNVSEDTIGANLVPETLETGDFIENASTSIKGMNPIYVIAYARNPNTGGGDSGTFNYQGCFINGIPSGLFYWIGHPVQLLGQLKYMQDYSDDIKAVFTVPSISVLGYGNYSIDTLDDQNATVGGWIHDVLTSPGREFTLNSAPSTLNGYTPRNQKLRQYPYCYLGFTPSNGEQKIFRYEDFQNATPSFKLICEINPNPSPTFIPKNYKGVSGLNVSESVKSSGYPSISWTSEYFSSWIAQNQNLVNLNLDRGQFNYEIGMSKESVNYMGNQISNAMNANVGKFVSDSGNVLLDTYSMTQNHDYDIKETMGQIEKQKMLPNTSSIGTNAGILGYGYQNSDIFTSYSIKAQFAERIDLYFDMYGYQTNKLKLPNITGRPNWNYVKTLGLNALQKSTANIPQEDLLEFKNLFNNGITLWHNPATFLDYSQNNR